MVVLVELVLQHQIAMCDEVGPLIDMVVDITQLDTRLLIDLVDEYLVS